MSITEIRAYRRESSGTMTITSVLKIDDVVCDGQGCQMKKTDEVIKMFDWVDDACDVYNTDGGVEVLVPRA